MSIYLDHNAATPLLPEAEEAAWRSLRDGYGNASSLHSQGRQARRHLEEAREIIAAHLGCPPHALIFTSGGTESDHLALRGVMAHPRSQGRHLAVSAFEHPAVLEPSRDLADQGCMVSWISPNDQGLVTGEALRPCLSGKTALVSILAAHNEIGTLQPIAELAALAHAAGALFHTDAAQALGKGGPLRLDGLGADLVSLSGHKIGGLKGAGALYIKPGTPLKAQQTGGPQERQFRAGTENVAACLSMAAALQAWEKNGQAWRRQMQEGRDALQTALQGLIPEMRVNGGESPRLPNTLHITLPGCPSDLLVAALDMRGVSVSAGSACASGAVKSSKAMLAMGKTEHEARCVLRLSLGVESPSESWESLARRIADTAQAVRGTGFGK